MQLLAVVCSLGAYAAYNVGDYIYSPTAKYKITGENLVTNGTFDVGDGFAGWTNESGSEVDGAVWAVSTGLGPNGENVIVSLQASADSLSTLRNSWTLNPGFYTISYWVKSPSALSSSVTEGNTNYVNLFLNDTDDNTITTAVAQPATFLTDWTQVVFTAQVDAASYLVLNANNVATDIMFTGFEIHQAIEVYDTRIAARYVADVEKLLAEPEFADEADEVLGALFAIVKPELEAGPEDGTTITDLIQQFDDEFFKPYIDRKAGNTVGTYLTNWNTWPYINWNNMSTRNQWTFEGGRWGFSPNDESLERPAEDGYVASAGIQTSYDLEVGLRIAAGTFTNTSLKAGKYMFSVEAQANASANKAAPYGADHSYIINDPSIWVGADTTLCENDTLNGYYWKRYYTIVEVTEEQLANGTEVSAGFIFPRMGNGRGGRYSLRNPEFRVVGKTQDEVDHIYSYDQLAVQQDALKLRLDSAVAVNALRHSAGYPWGHAVLQDSINKFTEVYQELLTVVDANGNELQPDRVTLAYKDEILAAVSAMNTAISHFYSTNKVYQTLIIDIATCTKSLNAEANAAGDKATFQAVISQAQGMVDATTVDADEVDAFNVMDAELLTAKETFEMGTASRANPASLYVADKNLNFESWTSKSTYSSDRTVNGWELTIGTDGKQWDISPNDGYQLGGRASIWRGTSVGPNGKIRRTHTITKPGVYEFRTRAFSAEYGDGAHWNEYMAIASLCGSLFSWETLEDIPVDTIYKPNVRVFFGPEGSVNDSVTLTKCAPADFLRHPTTDALLYTRETGLAYSIIYVKTTSDEETVELGLEAFENGATAGASTFGLGDNRLYFLGSEADYTAATDAEYAAEVAKAKEAIAKYGVDLVAGGDSALYAKTRFIAYKMQRYIGDAEYPWGEGWSYKAPTTLQEKQNVILTLQELQDMLSWAVDPETMGIEEVPTANVRPVEKSGVYSLSGAKVGDSLNGLPKGIYIFNGRKYMVK
mgnify:CR=1 FL=1